jgi:coenzyme PQQ synthesis protein D (PqqD)
VKIEKASQVVYTPLEDGRAVLLNLDTLIYFSLNRTGATLWELISETGEIDEAQLVQSLCNRFEVETETAQREVSAFLDQLRQLKFVRLV